MHTKGMANWLVENRLRLFLGNLFLEDMFFPNMFEVAALLLKFRFRRNEIPPVPLERILEQLELYTREEYQ